MAGVFRAAACLSVLCVALICAFLLANGLPAMAKVGPLRFLTGEVWRPSAGVYEGALGETMAVIMVAGNQPRMPKGLLQGARTLTGNIVIEIGYAAGLHRGTLIATGAVLFALTLFLNLAFSAARRRRGRGRRA